MTYSYRHPSPDKKEYVRTSTRRLYRSPMGGPPPRRIQPSQIVSKHAQTSRKLHDAKQALEKKEDECRLVQQRLLTSERQLAKAERALEAFRKRDNRKWDWLVWLIGTCVVLVLVYFTFELAYFLGASSCL